MYVCFVKPINTEKNLVMCFAMFLTQETCLSYSKAAKEIENIGIECDVKSRSSPENNFTTDSPQSSFIEYLTIYCVN